MKNRPKRLTLQDYRLVELIGVGSIAFVWQAQAKNGRQLACKVVQKDSAIKSRQAERVINQISVLGQLKNPFIVELEGVAQDASTVFIMQELLEGVQLFEYLKAVRRLDALLVTYIGAQIVLAMEYLHSKHIIFRDLKPQNLVVNRDGFIKLTDFGQAKAVTGLTYSLCGTPEYLAPEVILALGHSKPVDWWTLGILLYELQAGITPFTEDDPLNVYQKILRGKLRFPRDMDPDLISLLKGLLVADPGKRLGSWAQGAIQIKGQKVFARTDWAIVSARKKSPFVLRIQKDDSDPKV